MNANEATREVFWNITNVWLMYVLFAASLAIAIYGIYRRVARWRKSLTPTTTDRFDRPRERMQLFLRHALAQGRTVRDAQAGLIHSLIFAGFIILAVATTVVFVDYDLSIRLMRGSFYLYFQSLIVDVFGAFFIAGLVLAALRRLILRPAKLVHDYESLWLLILLFVIGVSGFVIEGLRIAATQDPYGAWSPFGNLIARGRCGRDERRADAIVASRDVVGARRCSLRADCVGAFYQAFSYHLCAAQHLHCITRANWCDAQAGRFRCG